ncbi:MAG: hypothetical protein ACD_43C00147G0001 [uncultured bacterium]|nr:MAG: hypothetical protein ACD_43C00147G0001 [uncultured bacterium]
MGFFDKIKQSLNIGGVKLVLVPTQTVVANGTTLPVKLTVTGGKINQPITVVAITLMQRDAWVEHQLGGQRIHKTQTMTLAKKAETTPFTITAGEQREFNFSLPVQAVTGLGAQQTGVMGALSKISDLATSRKHEWWIEASVAIEGSMDASVKCDIQVQLEG